MTSSLRLVIFTLVLAMLLGCGKYGRPMPPEHFAPRAVADLEVTAQEAKITFAWRSPRLADDGRELKSMEGYRLYRKTIKEQSDISDNDVEFELITTVSDTHVQVRDQLRAEARVQGKPGRKIQPPAATMKFEYSDGTVKEGETYLYKLVPINQGGVEGDPGQPITIVFKGLASKIIIAADSSKTASTDQFDDAE